MKKLLYILFVCISCIALGQEATSYLQEAKALAATKNYKEAQKVVSFGLESFPLDHDLKSYQIRIHLWSEEYGIARGLISELLRDFPDDYEGLQLQTTENEWSNNWKGLLTTTELAISLFPKDQGFRMKKLLALKNLQRYREATEFSKTISEESVRLKAIKSELRLNHHQQLGIASSYAHFTTAFSPWVLNTLRYQRVSKSSFNVSATYGKMFDQTGMSFNAEYYPRISKKLTGFFEFGTTNATIFPQLRAGGELTAQLRKFEISIGGKTLQFKEQTDGVTLLTLGLGSYFNQYFTSYKAYLSRIGTTQSITHTLLVRRFFKNRFHYFQINLTEGATPLQINNFSEASRVSASAINLTYSQLLYENYITSLAIGGQKERYEGGVNRERYTAQVSVSRLF